MIQYWNKLVQNDPILVQIGIKVDVNNPFGSKLGSSAPIHGGIKTNIQIFKKEGVILVDFLLNLRFNAHFKGGYRFDLLQENFSWRY